MSTLLWDYLVSSLTPFSDFVYCITIVFALYEWVDSSYLWLTFWQVSHHPCRSASIFSRYDFLLLVAFQLFPDVEITAKNAMDRMNMMKQMMLILKQKLYRLFLKRQMNALISMWSPKQSSLRDSGVIAQDYISNDITWLDTFWTDFV